MSTKTNAIISDLLIKFPKLIVHNTMNGYIQKILEKIIFVKLINKKMKKIIAI
ncbi:hypothetical protein GW820_06140 [archaeon]|nr:hypothetical protein [archaeon]